MADQPRDTSFDRIAILVLAIDWILFGSMHFSSVNETVAQMPEWLPAKHDLAIVTGIMEVSTGVLILVPELRKWAAAASLGLLVLLSPAMYRILSDPAALESLGSWATVFRIAMLPNNIFMAICAVHLWRHPEAALARPDPAPASPPARRRKRDPMPLLIPAVLLLANCAGFLALAMEASSHAGLADLWAMGCIAAGALIGFLFAVPRVNPSAPAHGQFLPNTNVEAVSDWLTKILVGVSLVNLQAIGGFIDGLARDLAPALGTPKPFATGLIVYFFVVGVIQGYILTRLFLPKQFEVPG